jgi:hypothetical protein
MDIPGLSDLAWAGAAWAVMLGLPLAALIVAL